MTEASLRCPECGSTDVARGRLSHGRPGTFTLDGLRFWTLTAATLPLHDRIDPGSTALTGTAHACTACGLVWSHVDPERLRFVLRNAGTRNTRKKHGSNGGEQQ
jgi:predicted RNA-binding Zn-ribbon protein involved in translation (DUF1610 family)